MRKQTQRPAPFPARNLLPPATCADFLYAGDKSYICRFSGSSFRWPTRHRRVGSYVAVLSFGGIARMPPYGTVPVRHEGQPHARSPADLVGDARTHGPEAAESDIDGASFFFALLELLEHIVVSDS